MGSVTVPDRTNCLCMLACLHTLETESPKVGDVVHCPNDNCNTTVEVVHVYQPKKSYRVHCVKCKFKTDWIGAVTTTAILGNQHTRRKGPSHACRMETKEE